MADTNTVTIAAIANNFLFYSDEIMNYNSTVPHMHLRGFVAIYGVLNKGYQLAKKIYYRR